MSVLDDVDTDALVRRRGELCYGAQMSALEGLPLPEGDAEELARIDIELKRRGVDPHGDDPAKPAR